MVMLTPAFIPYVLPFIGHAGATLLPLIAKLSPLAEVVHAMIHSLKSQNIDVSLNLIDQYHATAHHIGPTELQALNGENCLTEYLRNKECLQHLLELAPHGAQVEKVNGLIHELWKRNEDLHRRAEQLSKEPAVTEAQMKKAGSSRVEVEILKIKQKSRSSALQVLSLYGEDHILRGKAGERKPGEIGDLRNHDAPHSMLPGYNMTTKKSDLNHGNHEENPRDRKEKPNNGPKEGPK